jgi:hypothetical protein
MGPVSATIRSYGFLPSPDFWAYLDFGASEFGLSTLWLVSTSEIGDTIFGFYHNSSMLSANMGARGCHGTCRY